MSFAAFLIYIVFTFLRPFDLFFPALIPYRPMLILWLIAFLLAIGRLVLTQKAAGRPAHFVLMVLLLLAVALSSLARDGLSIMLTSIIDFLPAISLMFLAIVNLTSLTRVKVTCATIVLCMLTLSAAGIAAYHTGFMVEELVLRQNVENPERDLTAPVMEHDTEFAPPAADKSGTSMWRVRSVGFLNDPNDFSQALIMCLPLVMLAYAGRGWIMRTLLVAVPIAAMLYTIMLTQSRGAIIGLAALGGLLMQRVVGTVITAWVAGLGVVGLMGLSFGGGRAFSTEEDSAAQRIDAWWEGINLLKAYPVFGAGFGNFTNHHYLTAHNAYVLCFSELGLFGFFAWLGLIVLGYRGLAQATKLYPVSQADPYSWTAEMLRFSFVGYFVCAWFLSRTYSPFTFLLLGVTAAAWYCAHARVASEAPVAQPVPYVPWRTATATMMAVTVFGVYGFLWLSG
ncbi:MAG: O-antigen ligase family protein [Burkholderiaceae bacterium]